MNPNRDVYLGSHQLVRRLGRGGMAEVFLALKLGAGGFQRRVVVKCLHDHLCGNPEAENRFIEEAVLGGLLEHENIIRVLDLAKSGGRLYMILDYVAGVDLRTLLSSLGALPLSAVLHIGRELARGLHYAHTLVDGAGRPLNLVHRDVSPANILVCTRGQVKLTDFGVAKALGREQTRGGIVKGKYGYMSPEQVQQRHLDARSDQFSLATVMLEALTGESVFTGSGPLQIMEQVLEGCVPKIPAICAHEAPELEALLGKMLALEPQDRLADTRAVAKALNSMLKRLKGVAPDDDLGALVQQAESRGSDTSTYQRDTTSSTVDSLSESGRPDSETDHYGVPLDFELIETETDGGLSSLEDDTSQYKIANLEAGPPDAEGADPPSHADTH